MAAEPPAAAAPATTAPLLASFNGQPPPAPAWFQHALADAPERSHVDVNGAAIEALAWGRVDAPGLLLVHGKLAHADWWRFIAPFFAQTHRVVALSLSGMGGSGWRASYPLDGFADELLAVAQAGGLFEGPVKPVVVAHSFGGFVALRSAERDGARWGGTLLLDVPLLSAEQRAALAASQRPRDRIQPKPTRVYSTLAAALARFRFAPEQGCDNLFIADHIARTSLKTVAPDAVAGADTTRVSTTQADTTQTGTGWTWRFDPQVALARAGDAASSLRHTACPIALAWGADSALVTPAVAAHMRSLAPAGTPAFAIPAAQHHVMVDQPLALVSAMRALLTSWPQA